MTTRTKPLVEGALLAAAAVVLVLLGTYLPVAGPLFLFAWPLPVVIIFVRHGWRSAVLTVVVAGLLLAIFVGPLNAVLYAIVLGSMGLALGWTQWRRLAAGPSIVVATGAMLVALVASIASSRLFLGQDVLQELLQAVSLAANEVPQIYARIGAAAAVQEQMRQTLRALQDLVPMILPVLLLLSALFYAFVTYLVMQRVLRRLGYPVAELPPFADWRVPAWAVVGWAAGIGCLYLAQRTGTAGWRSLGLNLTYLFQLVYLVAGLAFGYYLLRRYRLSRVLAVVLLGFAALNPLLSQLAVWAGIFESVFGYRRLLERRSPQGGST